MSAFGGPGESRRFRLRFLGAALFTLALLAFGTIGFSRFEGWSISDGFYMTVITLSSVGYTEVQPMGDGERAFAAVLIVGGVAALGIWFALITSTLVEMDLAHSFRKRRTMKTIEKLKNHVIVCGAGRMGRQVVKELLKSRMPYVVIERDDARAELVREIDPDALVISGDATHDETLVAAGIGYASGLVTALAADTDNLFVCLTGRDLQPNLTIVSRAYDEDAAGKLRKAGANQVVSPNITGGIRMASVLLRPQVVSFLDVVTRSEDLDLILEEVTVPETSGLAGRSLAEAQIPRKTGLIVIAIRHGEDRREPFIYNPGPNEEIRSSDKLIVLGQPSQIDRLREELG